MVFSLNNDTIYELAEPGTFIGRSPPNAFKHFFCCRVKSKDIAKDDLIDKYGQCILGGESYLEVIYLQKINGKTGKSVKYEYRRNGDNVYYAYW